MKTDEFPLLSFPFEEFNLPQAKALQFVQQDCNLVLALNTATGKTAVAMCFFAHELSSHNDTKCLYASPLKAISQERLTEFENVPEWRSFHKLINTSDHFVKPEDFLQARVVILTSETLDSKSRNPRLHGEWLKKTGVLVLDELHLLDDPDRGPALESGIVNFTRLNKNARLVALSATMTNAKEVATWFKSLNDKPTYVVSSDWRPVQLCFHWTGTGGRGTGRWQQEQDMLETAVRVASKHRDEKVLLFVHSKRLGRELVKELRKRRLSAEFYHSGLKKDQRATLESLFQQQHCGLNVLVTTSALAMGVNL